jgi:hypothetical protein
MPEAHVTLDGGATKYLDPERQALYARMAGVLQV